MTIARGHIASMAAYALADLSTPPSVETISLSQNESFRPPTPRVAETVKSVLSQTMLYPDPDWSELREALSEIHSIDADLILCGSGSLNLIAAIANVFSGPDRAVIGA